MLEVEVKFRIAEKKIGKIEQIMKDKGFDFKGEFLQIDTVYLEKENKSFATFMQGDAVVRVRKNNDIVILTGKKKIDDGSSIEYETICNDYDSACQILGLLGMNRVTQIEKTRKEYISDIYTVAIDNAKDLGRFIEIESLISDELQKLVTLDNIMQLASELGLQESDIETRKYDMLLQSLPHIST